MAKFGQYSQNNNDTNIQHNNLVEQLNKELSPAALLGSIMPVGYVYLSAVATSPATLFGFGTWTQIKDTFILTAGDTYTAGNTGGAATVTLDTTMIPAHSHSDIQSDVYGQLLSNAGATVGYSGVAVNSGDATYKFHTGNTGGGLAHNNMPPYKVYYAWERTA